MKIVIIGAGTTAIAVADILVHDRNFIIAGFVGTTEENNNMGGKNIYGDIPFIGDRSILKKLGKIILVPFILRSKNGCNSEQPKAR